MAERQKQFASAPHVKSVFEKANPAFYGLAPGDVGAMRQLAAIHDRADALKARFQRHFAKYQETWVSKEVARLLRKQETAKTADPIVSAIPKAPAPSPPKAAMSQPMTEKAREDQAINGLMRQARANVRGRAHNRLIAINRARTKLHNAIVNNARDPFLSRRFQNVAEPEPPAPRYIRRRTT